MPIRSTTSVGLFFCTLAYAGSCTPASDGGDRGGKGGDGRGGGAGGQAGSEEQQQGGEAGRSVAAGGTTGAPVGTGGVVATGGTPAMGGSGGTVGTGGTKAGGSGGTIGTGGAAGLAFTTDFEQEITGKLPAAPWRINGGADVTIAEGRAYSGKKSMKVVSSSGETMASLSATPLLTRSRSIAYTRFMVWMDAYPTPNATDTGHWDLFKYSGNMKSTNLNINGYLAFGGFSNQSQKFHVYGNDVSNKGIQDCSKGAAFAVKPKTWACVEIKVDAESLLQYGVSVNGKPIAQFSFLYDSPGSACVPDWNVTKGIWYLPEILSIKLGFNHIHAQVAPVTVYFDDVAVADHPIGCPPAPQAAVQGAVQ